MNTIQELQKLREELIREIDEKFDWIIDEVKKESVPSRQKESRKPRNYEIIYSLSVGAGIFKGKRPTGVIFADGRRTENPTWKSVAEELLKDCCKDSDQRQALMDLREGDRFAEKQEGEEEGGGELAGEQETCSIMKENDSPRRPYEEILFL